MKTIPIAKGREIFNNLDVALREHKIIKITRHGRIVFAAVDLDYFEAITETIEILSDPEATKMLQRAIDDILAGRMHDHADVASEFDE